MLGVMFYTMANSGRIQALTDGRCDPGDVNLAIEHMIPVSGRGLPLRARARQFQNNRRPQRNAQ